MTVTEILFELQDIDYADFQSKLIPGIDRTKVIGVRVPEIRKIAKQMIKQDDYSLFLISLPHKYYDEDILHGLIISQINDFDLCINEVDKFLPYINNWAVCDLMSPKIFKSHKYELLQNIYKWTKSNETYTIRFGIEMLIIHFLDEDFNQNMLDIPANIQSDDYYVKMMQAWYFATALAKQWNSAIEYIENSRLDKWTHNKTIQKAIESYRITDEQKTYLRTLKRKN